MQKKLYLPLTILLLSALSIAISSCDDDEPPAKAKLSFEEAARTVAENVGTIRIDVVLDKPASQDIVVDYDLGGTAFEVGSAASQAEADYEIVGDAGQVEIQKGESKGTIEIKIYSDSAFEPDETIEISIDDVDSENVEIAPENEIVITITNDDQQISASFATTTATYNEEDGVDGLISVDVALSQAPTQNVTVKYTLAGSAFDSLKIVNGQNVPSEYWDYYINGKSGELTINAGQTTGKIEIQILSDFLWEDDETIEITLTEGTGGVNVSTTNNKATLTLKQQDGMVLALVWDDAYTDVDMDFFLYGGETTTTLEYVLAISANAATTPQNEIIFLPDVFEEGAFGLACNYYDGSVEPMNFEVQFAKLTNGQVEDVASRDIRSGTYNLVNKSKWDEGESFPPHVLTFEKQAGAFVNISEITVPASGSRINTIKVPVALKRSTSNRFHQKAPIFK